MRIELPQRQATTVSQDFYPEITMTQQFLVIGQYDSERNSWIPGGDIRHVVSQHRTERAAWRACDRAHSHLGGCDGGNSLATVVRRFAKIGSRKAKAWLERQDQYSTFADWYEHDGWLFVGCDFWQSHKIAPASGGLALAIR
jgi:hypothetical protein